jgi:hypothetical protein
MARTKFHPMNRKIILVLVFIPCLFCISSTIKPSVKYKYNKEYNDAKHYCKSIKNTVDSVAVKFKLNSNFLLPIVFPECMRFSVIQNSIETNALEIFYTKFGKEYSDFSIGRFQMKPSFVETLEAFVLLDKKLHNEFGFILMKEESQGARSLRIDRLKNINWQIIYLSCFYKIVEIRFHNLSFLTIADKINFYATAYNVGFTMPSNEIKKWQTINIFPSGHKDNENNYPYGSISLEYFNDTNP